MRGKKKLFQVQSSSEEEDPVSVDDRNDEDEDEEGPYIHLRVVYQKLKSLRVSSEEKKGRVHTFT